MEQFENKREKDLQEILVGTCPYSPYNLKKFEEGKEGWLWDSEEGSERDKNEAWNKKNKILYKNCKLLKCS